MRAACGERRPIYTAIMARGWRASIIGSAIGWRCLSAMLMGALLCCGCVERTITVNSNPPGALVYLNDREVGRTPVTRDFTWYGVYEVTLRKDGYQALKTQQNVFCPIYELVPLDLISELLPVIRFHDDKQFSYNLQPIPPTDKALLMQRALEMKGQLESGRKTPTTQPVKAHAAR
jgi:hypothetical protein